MLTSDQLRNKYFSSREHPYRIFESKIQSFLPCKTMVDLGCGKTAPVLRKYVGKANMLIGIDLEKKTELLTGINYLRADIASLPLPERSIDLLISRSVLEHLPDPHPVFAEIARVLKPKGNFVFLTANIWDYVSLVSRLIPNKWHGFIVRKTEGRNKEDTFPTHYKVNSYSAIKQLAEKNGLKIIDFQWLGQYPSAFYFNPYLFFAATGYHKLIERFNSLRFLRGWLLIHLAINSAYLI